MESHPTTGAGARYEFKRELGRGGMGRVFLVHDTYLDRDLALKRLHEAPGDAGEIELLEREFAFLAGVDCPRVAKAFDFGFFGETPYFTTEYVEGKTVERSAGQWSVSDLLILARQLADAVAFLHRSEVLHLDIKPSNIILRADRSDPVLVDFGLIRRGVESGNSRMLRGSLPYMAPEYFHGGSIGPWTDVYSLGVTLFKLATGRLPRPLAAGESREPHWIPVTSVGATTGAAGAADGPLESMILKCLALDPALRYESAAELLEALGGSEAANASATTELAPTIPTLKTVGREHELAEIDAFLDSCHAPDSPSVLVVTGSTGMGQSHLLREIKVRGQTRGHRVYIETAYAGRRSEPGAILRGLAEHISSDSARRRWRGFLRRLRRPRRTLTNHTLHQERRVRRIAEVSMAARAVAEPLLIGVDGLQNCDEVSIELVTDLARILCESPPSSRPPIALVLGYREEGPVVSPLRELSGLLLNAVRARIITLRGLSVGESVDLFRRWSATRNDESLPCGELELFQRCGGIPARIAALTPHGRNAVDRHDHESTGREIVDPESRDVALTLDVLMRPASTNELARILGHPAGRIRRVLESLESSAFVERLDRPDGPRGRVVWNRRPALERLANGASPSSTSTTVRRRLHERIGDVLASSAKGESDPALAEAVRHFAAAECSRKFLAHAPRVAAFLLSTFQNRLALDCHRAILKALPASATKRRREIVLEIAELHARVGDLDEGIHFLREFLFKSSAPGGERSASRLVLLRLATLYSRRGDFRRADALFQQGLTEAGDRDKSRRARLTRSQRLYFLNEHAALKAFLGEYDAALELCERGLARAGNVGDRAVREVVLNLHATRATVALRRFDFDAAAREFETALDIAESIGSPVNQAVILNNLGTVYAKMDRYREAIRTFRDAERTCLQLDEGPSLASIYANLGILHAKIGDGPACDAAFDDAARLGGGAIGQREEFFLAHARGLAAIYRGQYAAARDHLGDAIARGESLGDRHVVGFDRIFRAEALIALGSYREAGETLVEHARSDQPATLRRMALARLAHLDALAGRIDSMHRRVADYESVRDESPAALIRAWDSILIARGLASAGDLERIDERLDFAEPYFERHEMRGASALVACTKAECFLARGDFERAREIADSIPSRVNDAVDVERAIILASCLLAASTPDSRCRASDLLADAGVLLRSSDLPEQRSRYEHLRAQLDEAACDPPSRSSDSPGATALATTAEETAAEETAALSRAEIRTRRQSLIAESAPMKSIVAALDRFRDSDLPILITGETGTGKELVARIIHEESRRRDRVFQVVDCAAIPESLLQVELFGAREGAYTDGGGDRKGILELAAGGTVFVDEVANTSVAFQGALLRVLAEGSIRAVGADVETEIDVRFLMSTSRDLATEVEKGRFREDLYHRIDVLRVDLPPLRDRREDFAGLIEHCEGAGARRALDPAALRRLQSHPWPGNVRELRNFLERSVLEGDGSLTLAAVEEALDGSSTRTLFPKNILAESDLAQLRKRLERDFLVYHFRRFDGDAAALCEFLSLSRRQLYNRCEHLGISLREERARLARAEGVNRTRDSAADPRS